MSMRTTPWLLVGLGLIACKGGDSPASSQPDEYIIDCENLPPDAGAGTFASDENWDAFVNAEAARKVQTTAAQAPVLTAPAAGSPLSAASPPTFTFRPTPSSARAPRHGCRPRSRSVLARLAALVEGTAEAHCGAFTGENYVFRVTPATGGQPIYLAVLSVTSFMPDASAWTKAMAGRAGQNVSITIERGIFFKGDLTEGPYIQPAYTFSVGP
jgi:hypothetical protein